jgi:hypothetical protein
MLRASTLLITATIVTYYLILVPKYPTSIPLYWRIKIYQITNIKIPRQAPLRCTSPNKWLIPERYYVYLHLGFTLDQHKQAVRDKVDLDSEINYVQLETSRLGAHYGALLNESALAAVRSNLIIAFLECQYTGELTTVKSNVELK